jgi:hypothetical protein
VSYRYQGSVQHLSEQKMQRVLEFQAAMASLDAIKPAMEQAITRCEGAASVLLETDFHWGESVLREKGRRAS